MTGKGRTCSLEDQVAVVTGAAGGLGYATALCFAEAGAHLVLTDLPTRLDELNALAASIEALGVEATVIPVDVGNKVEVTHLFDAAMEKFGRVDILVNTAAYFVWQNVVDFDEEDWDRVIRVNLKGCFLCCQAAARIMQAQKSGNIINVASDSAFDKLPEEGAYAASKAGVVSLTKILAQELGSSNIRVNGLAPGWIKTPMTEFIWKDQAAYDQFMKDVPLGRMSTPEEQAGILLFLASSLSGYITGEVVLSTGGRF